MLVAHAAWSAPPLVITLTALSAGLFAQGWLRLRRRGRPDLASWWRVVLFALGLLVALAGLVTPIHSIGEHHLLSVHMLQHVLIGDLSPALLVTAVRGPLLVFLIPARVLGPLARSQLRTALGVLLQPRVTLGLWAANLAVWHVPRLYDAALFHPVLHDVEHACWVISGLLIWTLLVDPGAHRRLSVGGRVATAAAMFAAGQVLTDVLVFTYHVIYLPYGKSSYGLSPITDQQLAGVVMMVEQLLTLGTLVALLLRPRFRIARLAAA